MVSHVVVLLLLTMCAAAAASAADQHYTHQWVLHVPGGPRVARAVVEDHGFEHLGEIFEDYYHVAHRGIAKRSLNAHPGKRAQLAADTRVLWAQQQRAKRRVKRDYRQDYSDPRWPNMWYLNRGSGLDMNVIPAWQEGVTGKGAVVTILDDGLEKDHPDLIQNYDPLASYDVNNQDSDPSPRYDMMDSNRHGTRCAGEVAASANNSICSLGVAYGAQVGGVRMLDGDVTDAVEARSLSLNPQHIDIYSASWGPDDDGKTVDGPGELAMRAFMEGVTKGRTGKGSIFVWASGNGGRDHDNCNCDGYTNSIYSLSISSATEHGRVPWYSEACSSTLATTYSSGEASERQVITTDLHHACTSSHTGTSASAPLAAGICALALEANPALTWRDMQHIVVRTARPQRLVSPDWQVNGVGRNVSHSFGYGLMDAHAMVQLARRWITVPEQHSYEIKAPQVDKKIPARSVVVLSLNVNDSGGVRILEHVQAKLTITSHKRGDLNIQLISPMGTRVTLLAHRMHDLSRSGFTHWPFMSVHSWGESPLGTWTLEIHNDGRLLGRATLQSWSLVFYGVNQTNPNDIDPTQAKTNKLPKLPSHTNNNSNNPNNNNNNSSAKKKNKKPKPNKNAFKFTTIPSSKTAVGNNKQAKLNKTKGAIVVSSPSPTLKFYTSPTLAKAAKSKKPDFLPFYYAVNNSKFGKFPKNYTITYPIMIPEREFEKQQPSQQQGDGSEQHRKKMQKQKEKSRDLNSNRNHQQSARTTTTTSTTTTTTTGTPVIAKKAKTTGEIHAWELVLYGTSTRPALDLKQDDPFVHPEDIDENIIEPIDVVKSPPEIRKDLELEDEYTQSLNGCKTARGNVCIVCMDGYYFFTGTCVKTCPATFYAVTYSEYGIDPSLAPTQSVCEPCHYTCRQCSDANDYACTECFPDAFLHHRSNESYCYPQSVRGALLEELWCFRMFLLIVAVLVVAAFGALMLYARKCRWRDDGRQRRSFMKIDSLANIRDIERKVKSAVYSDSE